MKFQLDKIHHTALQVEDIDRAVSWYVDQFECQVQYQDESWAMLAFANVSLALVLPAEHSSHVAVTCSDLSPYREPLQHRDGTRSVYIQDPDGNNIELLQVP